MPFVKPKEALKHYKVTYTTLHVWRNSGKLKVCKTPGGYYLYWIEEYNQDISRKVSEVKLEPQSIIYARVSSKKQESELTHQIKFLQDAYPTFRRISDIGSGINYKRKGLQTLLDLCFKGELKEVVVAHKDRLSRLGFDLFKSIFKRFGTTLKVHDSDSDAFTTPDEELSKDLLEIITVFSARYYGRRSYSNEN